MPSNASEIERGDRNSICGLVRTASVFADSEYQLRIWVRGEGPDASSYLEEMEALFDDYRVRDFLKTGIVSFGCSIDMQEALAKFVDTIDNFDKTLQPNLSDNAIVALPQWKLVVTSAAHFARSARPWYEQNCHHLSELDG
jgi:hypothetical protein